MVRPFLLDAVVWLSLGIFVRAQTTDVTCKAEFKWMNNRLGQNPCLVAAYLSTPCSSGGTWNVPKLQDAGPYYPPSADTASDCRCNSVDYSLIQACSACQGGNIGSWSNWTMNCPQDIIVVGSYPRPLPAGTDMPMWSLLDPTTSGGSFSVNYAKVKNDQTGGSSNDSDSNSNLGPIIGGIAGGIGALIAVVLMIWFFHFRERRKNTRQDSGAGGSTEAFNGGMPMKKTSNGSTYKYDQLKNESGTTLNHAQPHSPYHAPSGPPPPPGPPPLANYPAMNPPFTPSPQTPAPQYQAQYPTGMGYAPPPNPPPQNLSQFSAPPAYGPNYSYNANQNQNYPQQQPYGHNLKYTGAPEL